MVVLPAARIETSLTRRTDRMTLEVLRDRQCCAAGPTQNSFLGKLPTLPHLGSMTSFSFMTLVTSVVSLTAFEFDGDTIQLTVVMGTAGLGVYLNTIDGDSMHTHPHTSLSESREMPHSRWGATRRGLTKPVSSSPPLKTVRTTGCIPISPLRLPAKPGVK